VVAECGDAPEAPRLFDGQRADVLITDIRMPPGGEDEGIRLASRLRESVTDPQIGTTNESAE
jgi:CheY-like chemotaxis protein